jgi:type IV fimbrial biogenesis protein FimT
VISRAQHGFSLIEMMISITVLAILVALGIPSYQQWMVNTKIKGASESIQNGLRFARNEAAQRGTNVRFELTSATSGADWTVCYLPVGAVDCPSALAIDPNSTLQQYTAAGGSSGVLLGASTTSTTYTPGLTGGIPTFVTFSALGRPSTILRVDAYSTQAGFRRLVTTISAGGMIRVCDPQFSQAANPQGCPP